MLRYLFRLYKPKVRHILLHHHLFKNAGTTIDWALQRSFGERFCDHRDDHDMIKGGIRYLGELVSRQPQLAVISSHHMPFDPDFQIPHLAFWHIFMLRDPVARVLSVYRYEKNQPTQDSLGAKMAKQLDMRGYFEWRLGNESPAVMRDFHVRKLSSLRHKRKGALQDADLELAISQATHPRVLVGFVERFDESMVLFEHVLRRSFEGIDLAHVVQNKSSEPVVDPAAELCQALGEEMYERLLRSNVFDKRLYESLSLKFDAQIAAIDDFEQKLSEYKGRCA